MCTQDKTVKLRSLLLARVPSLISPSSHFTTCAHDYIQTKRISKAEYYHNLRASRSLQPSPPLVSCSPCLSLSPSRHYNWSQTPRTSTPLVLRQCVRAQQRQGAAQRTRMPGVMMLWATCCPTEPPLIPGCVCSCVCVVNLLWRVLVHKNKWWVR